MKDGALKAAVGMTCITAVYSVYMTSHVLAGEPVPDGVVLTGIVGAVCGLAGYAYAKAPEIEDDEEE